MQSPLSLPSAELLNEPEIPPLLQNAINGTVQITKLIDTERTVNAQKAEKMLGPDLTWKRFK